jgi:hypothetical protein
MFWYAIKRGLGLGIVLGVIGLVAITAGVSQNTLSDEFRQAETVTGTVTRLERLERAQGGSTSVTWRVTVTVPGGQHREQVSGRFFDTLEEGQSIPVQRLDGTPPQYRIEPARLAASSFWAIGLGVVASFGGGLLGRFGWRTGRDEWRLATHGVPVRGEVVALSDAIVPKLTFAYQDGAGTRHEVSVPRTKGDWQIGQDIEVLYDPERPGVARLA